MAAKMDANIVGARQYRIETAAMLVNGGNIIDVGYPKTTCPPLVPGAVPLGAEEVLFGKPTVPVAIEGVPVSVSVMNGGTIPEFVGEVAIVETFKADVIEGGTKPEFDTVSAAVIDPSSLPGMADPTPELVNGVGMGRVAVSGLSAGSSS